MPIINVNYPLDMPLNQRYGWTRIDVVVPYSPSLGNPALPYDRYLGAFVNYELYSPGYGEHTGDNAKYRFWLAPGTATAPDTTQAVVDPLLYGPWLFVPVPPIPSGESTTIYIWFDFELLIAPTAPTARNFGFFVSVALVGRDERRWDG